MGDVRLRICKVCSAGVVDRRYCDGEDCQRLHFLYHLRRNEIGRFKDSAVTEDAALAYYDDHDSEEEFYHWGPIVA